MNAVIKFSKVTKLYRSPTRSLRKSLSQFLGAGDQHSKESVAAVKDLDFEIQSGEAVGIIGQNGAGKSTTLRLISGITRATSGSIRVQGRVCSLLELGAGFHPELTGRENIYLYGAILGLKHREVQSAFSSIVNFSELEAFLDTPVKKYSSGMYVRLAFAVAAHLHPDILVVDEVLAVGDAAFRQKCLDHMNTLLGKGVTLIFVSHNPHMVRTVCNRVIYLNRGHLEVDGGTEEALQAYERDLRWQGLKTLLESREARPDLVSSVNISEVQVLDLDGISRDNFEYTEGVRLRVTYATDTMLVKPVLHVRLFRDDGTACFTVRSNQHDAPLEITIPNGHGDFDLVIQSLQLYGGLYRAQVAILDSSDRVILSLAHSAWFQVNGPGSFQDERLGVYVPVTSWEIRL